MKFKENVIKPGMVIHCPKEEDARALLEKIGLDTENCFWNEYAEKTCYKIHKMPDESFQVSYQSINYFDSYDITEFSDLIEPEANKANDLANSLDNQDNDLDNQQDNEMGAAEGLEENLLETVKPITNKACLELWQQEGEEETVHYLFHGSEELLQEYLAGNSTGGKKSTDSPTGMTNQRAVEILSDYIERNERIIHDPETEAIRIATSALVEKEANKNAGKVNVLMDKYEQAKKPDEISAVEVLEWLDAAKRHSDVMEEAFGVGMFGSIFDCNTPRKIIEKITAYEAVKQAPKPAEVEWVDVVKIYKGFIDDGGELVATFANYPKDMDTQEFAENLIKEQYEQTGGGDYFVVIEQRCRVKGE